MPVLVHLTKLGYTYFRKISEEMSGKVYVQFPVKWNAFSDRNGMLFSGLTEWLSDINGVAR